MKRPHAGTVLQYKAFSLLRGEWRENGSFVGDKYPIQSAGRMAKNGCDSFDLGPKLLQIPWILADCFVHIISTWLISWWSKGPNKTRLQSNADSGDTSFHLAETSYTILKKFIILSSDFYF